MNTNTEGSESGEPPVTNEPEENVSLTAFDPFFSSLDRDHGSEVELARKEMASYFDAMQSAA